MQDGVGKRDVKFTEVVQTLSGMGRLETLVLGIDDGMSDSLLVEFGVSVLNGISRNKHTTHFDLYDWDERDHVLHSIIGRLPTDVRRQFIIGEYTNEFGCTYPCISRSASACGDTSQNGTGKGGIVGDGVDSSKCDVTDGDDTDDRDYTSAEGQEDDGDLTPSPSQSNPLSGLEGVRRAATAYGGSSQGDTKEGGIIVGDGWTGSRRDVTNRDDTDDRAYTSAEDQEDDGDHTPSPSQSTDPLADLEGVRRAATGPTHHPLVVRAGVSPALHGRKCSPPPPHHPPSCEEHASDCCCCSRCTVL